LPVLASVVEGIHVSDTPAVTLPAVAVEPAELTSPQPGLSTTLGTSNVVFKWMGNSGIKEYQLWLGSAGPGSNNLFSSGGTYATSVTVPALPSGGVTVYARLSSQIGGVWYANDYLFTEAGTPTPAVLSSPAPGVGTTLGTGGVVFQWTTNGGPTEYQLWLGTQGAGSKNLFNSGGTYATTAMAPSIPAGGVTVNARLWSEINGDWYFNDYIYTESGAIEPAVLSAPTPGLGTILGTSSVVFEWTTNGGATEFQLWLGTRGVGSNNLYNSGGTYATSATVPSVPAGGVIVYARLWSEINGSWYFNDYAYTETGTLAAAVLTTPTPGLGTTLGTSNINFQWASNGGPTEYQLWLGTAGPGSKNLYNSGGTYANSVEAPSLPAGGATVYARLWSEVNGVWLFNDYQYSEQ